MGHSQAQKVQTHERLVQIAARRIRERGLDALTIDDVMKEAGLTRGGFYKHFPSREALIAQAFEAATSGGAEPKDGRADFAAIVRAYLSARHRDGPGAGCTLGALASEAGRAQPRLRALLCEQIGRKLDSLEQSLPGDGHTREDAIFVLSTLVGGIGLARAASDPLLSDQILRSVGDRLLARFGADS